MRRYVSAVNHDCDAAGDLLLTDVLDQQMMQRRSIPAKHVEGNLPGVICARSMSDYMHEPQVPEPLQDLGTVLGSRLLAWSLQFKLKAA